MTPERIVVVGGGPAGLSVARAHREAGGRAAITLLTGEPHLPYRRPPLTKEYLRGELARDELFLEDERWFREHGVEIRHAPATAVDAAGRTVTLLGGDVVGYDALVLATGSAPQRPPIPGVELDGVLVMRSVDDSETLQARVTAGARRAVVVGSGFIGCETAASLRAQGVAVTVVSGDEAPQQARLGEEAGRRIASWLRDAGAELILGTQVAEVRDGLQVVLADGTPALEADVVVLGAGAKPRLELAESAGVELIDGGVACDATLRSSDPAIWAAGDLACAEHPLAGRRIRVEHWGDALAHGEAIGATLAGTPTRWEDVPGFWSQIGERTLKLVAWGDGHDRARLVDHDGGGWTVWYERDGICAGVLTFDADEDGDRGRELIEQGQPPPVEMR